MSQTLVSSAASSPSILPAPSSASTSPTSPDDNVDPLADIRLLLQHVARAFYEVRHILLFDQLIRKEAMKDEELARQLGIAPKELSKAANQLIRDQLVSVYLRAEVKPGAHKATQRTYYYIDYKHCVDVVKWRMWKMSKVLDDRQRNVIDGQGYVCPLCKKTYSTLDISGLAMTATSFLCEICSTPLNDNDNDIELQKNKDRMQRLNSQSALIKQNLQKADKVVVPAFDIAKWVAINMPLENSVDSSDGLAVATGGAKEAAVTVQLAQEGDMEAKRRLKEEQAEAKRQANALPVWIAQSTVNGDLTRAGMRDNKASSNTGNGVTFVNPSISGATDPKTNAEDAEYDAYIARLQSQAEANSSDTTPIFDEKQSPADSNGSVTSPSQSRGSSVGLGVKRPRSDQPSGSSDYGNHSYGLAPDSHSSKKTKVDATKQPVASPGEDSEDSEVKTMTLEGKLIQLDQITDEMVDRMSPDEYTVYATLMVAS